MNKDLLEIPWETELHTDIMSMNEKSEIPILCHKIVAGTVQI